MSAFNGSLGYFTTLHVLVTFFLNLMILKIKVKQEMVEPGAHRSLRATNLV